MRQLLLTLSLALFVSFTFAQNEEKKNEGYQFTPVKDIKHTSVKNQFRSGTCWSFSGLAFFEAEILRKTGTETDLSEMFVVYKSYQDKAEKYVRMHGKTNFGGGGGFNDVMNCIRKYGLITEEAYKGIQYNEPKHVHGEMDHLLKTMVDAVVDNKNKGISPVWRKALNGVLEAYLGVIPEKFTFNGKEFTPKTFVEANKINIDDYIMISSFSHHPYYKQFILEVEDNWAWDGVYNLPLNEMMSVINNSIEQDYTVAWASDVSEKGFSWTNGVAIVPEQDAANMTGLEKDKWEKLSAKDKQNALFGFEKPVQEKTITQEIRQMAFDNYETTDDHGMLLVGTAKDQNGTIYYKVKNSWDTDQKYKGYFYASKSFVEYKTTSIMVHKDALPKDIRKKLNI